MAMGAWALEKPRQLTVPAPYGIGSNKQRKTPDTIRALRDKLTDCQSENELLGNLVKDLKAERNALSNKLTIATKQLGECNNKAAAATIQAESATKEQKRFQAEVDRLSSIVQSHSARLQQAKQHQQELEDVAIELRAELDTAKAQLEAAEAAAQQAQQRCTAAEAKLVAAGLGNMPKMGPTAEQLVINSTQRIKELTEELATVKSGAEQQMTSMQQEVEQAMAAAQEVQQKLKQQAHQQELMMQQQAGQLKASEQQCKQLQDLVISMQQKVAEGKVLAQAQEELQQLKQDMLKQSATLQQQVCQLQSQLADAQLKHASALSDSQQQLMAVQRQLVAAQRERQELAATLVAVRQQESGHRLSAGEALTKVERLRGELVRCVGELQVQLETAAASGEQHRQTLQQLRSAEATAAAAREEAAEMRQQLVELATVTMAELREQVASEFVALTDLPGGVSESQLPLPISSYIKALEHAICDCEQRCKQLLSDTLTAQQQERELRQELAAAREQQAAAQRALQQQTQRLLAAEKMRLADLRELQGLEKRLLLSQQECWNLRDTLLKVKSGDAGAALLSATSAAVDNYTSFLSPAAVVDPAVEVQRGEQPQQQQQQPKVVASAKRPPGGLSWAAGAAEGTAAPAAASQYHSKLEQLRQLKSQLQRTGKGKAAAVTSIAADPSGAQSTVADTTCTMVGEQVGTGRAVADTAAAADASLPISSKPTKGVNRVCNKAAAAASAVGLNAGRSADTAIVLAATARNSQSLKLRSSSGCGDLDTKQRKEGVSTISNQDERPQNKVTELVLECQKVGLKTDAEHISTAPSGEQTAVRGEAAAAASGVQEPEWQQQLKQWEQQRRRWQQLETSGAFGLHDLPVAGDAAVAGHEPNHRAEVWDSGTWKP